MDQRKQVRDIDGLFRLINRMSVEATNREELSEAIKASGVDPAQFVSRVRSRLGQAMIPANSNVTPEARRSTLPLISELKRLSKLSAIEIARKLDDSLALLSAVERHPYIV